MQKKETAIEVKVGALVIFSTALLVAFVMLLGDFRFGDHYEVNVQFETAGGLKQGADVAISGIDVGNVRRIEFEKNEDPHAGLPAVAVEVTLRIDETYASAIREDSQFYITTRGVLGEPYVEISTPSFDSPIVESGATLRGVDPPRMEIILGQAEDLLETLLEMLDDEDEYVADLVANASRFFGVVGGAVDDNRDTLDSALAGLDTTSNEAADVMVNLNRAMGEDGERLDAIVSDVEATTQSASRMTGRLDGRIDPIVDDVSVSAEKARDITETVDRVLVDNEGRIVASLENVEASTEDLNKLTGDALEVMETVKEGDSTAGALLVERDLYEDLQDVMRIIKQQPWRILWKE